MEGTGPERPNLKPSDEGLVPDELPELRKKFILGGRSGCSIASVVMHSLCFTSLTTLSLLALPVLAASELKVGPQFAQYDADHDGKLSPAEMKSAPWAALFQNADSDGDGQLTLAEVYDQLGHDSAEKLRAAVPSEEELIRRFKAGDKNQDEQLAAEELGKLSWLLKLDRNDDDLVSLSELKLAWSKLPPAAAQNIPATPPPPFEYTPVLAQAPRVLRPTEYKIGRRITLESAWHHDPKAKATVVALISSTCPVSKRYLPELIRIAENFAKQGVEFHFVGTVASEDLTTLGLPGHVHSGEHRTLLAALGATSSTDTFILDAAQTLVYRGAIDDQYGLGYSKERATTHYLRDALQAVLAENEISPSATEAPGCALEVPAPPAPVAASITYHHHVSRILQSNCLECHHAGGIGPFALETYEQVLAKAGMIRKVVSAGSMPPWMAAPVPNSPHSLWQRDRSLVAEDQQTLLTWLEQGKPIGDPSVAPLPRKFQTDWMIGKPDAIYQVPQPIKVKAEGTMPYQNVTVETNLTEDRWVQAWEVQPTAREVVHHVLVFVKSADGTKPKNGDAYLAAFVPGNNYVSYPNGYGKYLPAGSKLRFQIHYTPNGAATTDQVRVGLIFTKGPPAHVVEVTPIAQTKLRIPAGASRHAETATVPVPVPVELIGFMPHMHLRGTSFRYDVTLPQGAQRNLLDVPRYDFNWQIAYRYQQPPILPAGSKIRATGWFDNSSNNPANPDPTRLVTWGEQTTDEMMIGYVEFALVK